MSNVIQNLLDNALGEGARGTKFEAFINFSHPALTKRGEDIYLMIKAASFPGKSHEIYDLKYKGRTIPIKGQIKYENVWTCTFYLTEDHWLKRSFEEWIESLDQVHNMNREISADTKAAQQVGTGYKSILSIAQLNFDMDQTTTVYNLYNTFPTRVSAVEVNYENTGSILEFTVDFSYSHFDSVTSETSLVPVAEGIKNGINGFVGEVVGAAKDALSKVFTAAKDRLVGAAKDKISGMINSIGGSNSLGKGAKDMQTRVDDVAGSINGGIATFHKRMADVKGGVINKIGETGDVIANKIKP